MATEVDICNWSLALLGDEATVVSINPPEGSAQADHCARFYPMALQRALAEYAWSFATKRGQPAQLQRPPVGTEYAYAYPTDCARLLQVVDESGNDIRLYKVERSQWAMCIITDRPLAYVRYVTSECPAELFSAAFVQCLVHLLASMLAGAVITGSTGASLADNQMQAYERLLTKAIQEDALQNCTDDEPRTPYTGDMVLPSMNDWGHYGK